MARTPSDLDIMMHLDGELHGEEAAAVEKWLQQDLDAANKRRALEEIGSLTRGSLELEVDQAEPRLAGLWSGIERAISEDRKAAEPARAAKASARAAAAPAGFWLRFREWFAGWQGHLATGALVAGAVALVMWTTRPERVIEHKVTVRDGGKTVGLPVALESEPPEVENLEVYEGSGMIMTIPADDKEDEGATTVIWIENDEDVVEEPI